MAADIDDIGRSHPHRPLLAVGLLVGLGLAGFLLSSRSGQPLVAKEPEPTKETATKDAPTKDAAGKESSGKQAGEKNQEADVSEARAKTDRAAIEELRDLAERSYEETFAFYESGDALATEVYRWSMVRLHYDLELADSDEKKFIATQDHFERMVSLASAGLWRVKELEFYVAEAEWLLDRAQPGVGFGERIALRKKLQGQWDVVSMEEDGKPQTKADIKSITISGRRATFEHRLGTAKALIGADPTTEPGTIDILGLNEDFPFGGQGIFKLEGDKLTLCWTDGGDRPKQFATKAGDKTTLCVLKRGH